MIYLPYTPNTTHRPIYSKLGDTGGFGPSSKFDFKNPFQLFNLPQQRSALPPTKLGISSVLATPAYSTKNPVAFLGLTAHFPCRPSDS